MSTKQQRDAAWAERFLESMRLAKRIAHTRGIYRRKLDEQLVGKCVARKQVSR